MDLEDEGCGLPLCPRCGEEPTLDIPSVDGGVALRRFAEVELVEDLCVEPGRAAWLADIARPGIEQPQIGGCVRGRSEVRESGRVTACARTGAPAPEM